MGLIDRFGTYYTLRRYDPGIYVKGRWEPGSTFIETQIVASIQPSTGKEREILPEGERTKEVIRIYTKYGLRQPIEQQNVKGDRISYKGRSYEVRMVETWEFDWNDMAHFKALAVMVEDD